MNDKPDLLNLQSILIVGVMAADGEISENQLSAAPGVLSMAFGISEDEALAKIEETSLALRSEDINQMVQLCAGSIRETVPPEGLQGLYNQLEFVAKCDGLDDSEAEILSFVANLWQVGGGAFDDAVKAVQKKKSGRET